MIYNFIILTILFNSALIIFRILKGPTKWDRLLGLNLLSAKFIILIITLAFLEKSYFLLDIAMVYGLLGFISIIFFSTFLGKGGKI